MGTNFIPESGPVAYQPEAPANSPHRQEAEAVLQSIPGVEGVGEGKDGVGDPAWIAYVRDAYTASLVPARIGNRRVVAETSGEIGILPLGGSLT